jgi:hypothetical protein
MTTWDDFINGPLTDEPVSFTYKIGNETEHVTVIPQGRLLGRRAVNRGRCDLCDRLVEVGVVWQWQGCWNELCLRCYMKERGCGVCRHLTDDGRGCEVGKTDNIHRDWRKRDCDAFERWMWESKVES